MPAVGTRVDRFTVTAPVAHRKHSTVVQARDQDGSFVALKLATTNVGGELTEQEALVLRALDGEVGSAPRLIAAGSAYLALSWTRGVEVRMAAGELREDRRATRALPLCRRIVRAYADVHERGVVHGQVQPPLCSWSPGQPEAGSRCRRVFCGGRVLESARAIAPTPPDTVLLLDDHGDHRGRRRLAQIA